MKRNVLHEIMTSAWRMFRVTGESFSECLKKAWQVYKLAKAMKSQVGRSDSRQSEGHRQKKERRPVHLLGHRKRIIQKFQEV